MIFRPTESSEKIVDFYRGYLTTTFSTNNEKYNQQLQDALSQEKAIADGPYISMTDPYEKGTNLVSLVEEGIVSADILKMKSFHPQRALYRHQEEAVRKASEGKNLIVTTGTGSGKTESFLIPLINYLLKEKENGTLSAGVRALIIYPMNALVNDQIRRLREIFSDYSNCGITFGKFTGETEETYKNALKKYQDNGDVPLDSCELISREQMRNTPPNILITNYAMLEYMLLRPGDNIIFDAAYADKWKYIVFDEAHSYTGAKGIEVGTLVKRIKAMLGRDDINFILTSATLGDKDSDDKIVQFGTSLCNAEFDPSCIIRSYTVEAQRNRDSISLDFQFYRDLAEKIRNDVSDEEKLKYISECNLHYNGNNYSSAIYDIILHDDFYALFRHYLYKKIKTVKSLAAELKMSENDVTDFITVASSAHTEAEKLFEAKYHMFIRGIEGVFVTLKPLEKLFIHQMENYHNPEDEKDYKVFQVSFCSNCSALFITAENVNGQLVQRSKYTNDSLPDVYLLSEEEYEEDDDPENESEEDGENIFYVCSLCGEIRHTKVVPEHLQNVYGIEKFSWVKSLFSDETPSDGICDIAIAKYNDEITKLEEEKKALFESGSHGVDALSYSINTIKNQGIIEFLSKNNIIPKYGFPVDTVELIESSKGSHPLRLSRDLFTAISEYAPGSEIVANGKLITSRYIKRLSGYEWPTYKYLQCEHCRSINQSINVSSVELRKCVQCGEDLVGSPSEYIIPKFGFIAEKNEKDVGINKPERTYHGAISYIGDEKNIEFAEYDVNGMLLRVGKSAMDSLLVLNESPFFVCKTCGYTTIKDGRDGTGYEFRTVLTETKSHNTPSGYKCNNKRLQRFSLGHEFKTDVIMLKFPLYVIDSGNVGAAWSILYSMLEGLSRCLNIDRKELSGCLQWYKDDECPSGNFGFVLFDNTPGGAGYVRQLEDPTLLIKMFKAAYMVVKNCDCGGTLADTSCYNCLRNYYNQKQHEIIKRIYAIRFFEQIMANSDEIIIAQHTNENEVSEIETMRIELLNKGRIQTNDTPEEIWHNLSDDCDDEEFDIIETIAKMCHNPIVKPIYNEQIRIINTGEEITVNELWPDKKVMLFISDNSEDYKIAKKTGWSCYMVSKSLDIQSFIKRIEV